MSRHASPSGGARNVTRQEGRPRKYYTYKDQVELGPGQTLGFTKGRGYYARDDERSASAPQTASTKSKTVQPQVPGDQGASHRDTRKPPASKKNKGERQSRHADDPLSKFIPTVAVAASKTRIEHTIPAGPVTIKVSIGAHASATGVIGDSKMSVSFATGYPRPKAPYRRADKKHGEIEVGLGPLRISDETMFSKSHLEKLKDPRYIERQLRHAKAANIKRVGAGIEFDIPAPLGKSHTVEIEHGGNRVRQTVERATLSVSMKVKGDGTLDIHESYSASLAVKLPNGSFGQVTYGLDLNEEVRPTFKNPGPDWKKILHDVPALAAVAATAAAAIWALVVTNPEVLVLLAG